MNRAPASLASTIAVWTLRVLLALLAFGTTQALRAMTFDRTGFVARHGGLSVPLLARAYALATTGFVSALVAMTLRRGAFVVLGVTGAMTVALDLWTHAAPKHLVASAAITAAVLALAWTVRGRLR